MRSRRVTTNARLATSYSAWPMFLDNPGHYGVSTETAISTSTASSLAPKWNATIGTQSYTSPAVAPSSTNGPTLVYAGANNHFYGYPTTGGAPVWTYTLPAGVVETSPAVFRGVVYIGSTAGTFYALNASTGALECSYSTGGQAILASPVVVNAPDGSGPVMYDGSIPGSSATGAEWAIYGPGNKHGGCTVDWEFNSWPGSPDGSWSSPAYGTSETGTPLVVFGSKDTDDSVYALNANTGALVWRYQTSTLSESDVGADPTISPPGRNGFADGVVYVTGKDKVVYAINLTTGALIWQHRLGTGTEGDVAGSALLGNRLFVGSDTGVYSLNALTGALVWNAIGGSTFYGSPTVTGPAGARVVIADSIEGNLYAFNLTTGATLWTAHPGGGFWASPAISQGGFYIAALNGALRYYAPAS